MIVPLLLLVAALTAALIVLLTRLRRLHAASHRADARLSEVRARVASAELAARAALAIVPAQTTETHVASSDGRSDGPSTRPARRARRATAIPDRP